MKHATLVRKLANDAVTVGELGNGKNRKYSVNLYGHILWAGKDEMQAKAVRELVFIADLMNFAKRVLAAIEKEA